MKLLNHQVHLTMQSQHTGCNASEHNAPPKMPKIFKLSIRFSTATCTLRPACAATVSRIELPQLVMLVYVYGLYPWRCCLPAASYSVSQL